MIANSEYPITVFRFVVHLGLCILDRYLSSFKYLLDTYIKVEVLRGIFHFSTNRTNIKPTELRMNENYQHYYLGWSRSILLAFIPFLLLSILNGKIIFQLQKSKNDPITRVSIFPSNVLLYDILYSCLC